MSFRHQRYEKPELLRRYLKVGYYQNNAVEIFGCRFCLTPHRHVDRSIAEWRHLNVPPLAG